MAKVFFSYAHEDEELRDKLETHLALLKRQGVIATWHDRRIGPGDAFADEIDAALETSDIVLLLVSADFLASDYCHDIEMRRALERHDQGLARVIPIILRPCDWHSSEFGQLNAVPRDGKPITKHATLDDGFVQVAEAIRSAVQEASGPAAPAPQLSPSAASTPLPGRSSNLRIPRSFSDRDRDCFFDEGLQYLSTFFESSLQELQSRYDAVETSFRRIDADRFEAIIYLNGSERTRCGIWRAQEHWSTPGLRYSNSGVGNGNGFNESLSVENDGYTQFWKPMGMALMRREVPEQMTHHGAAEYLWDVLIEPLRRS
jgi:hypothetical protein